jgi:ABC-type Fe3+/spermidine/putrescine transport system ATPase subunit
MFDVELVGVQKSFGSFRAVEDFSLGVYKGEFLTLLGPSGCGKTTIMKIVAGLVEPTAGNVIVRGEVVNDRPPYERDVSLMFQNYALFPHRTVFENVAFGLKYRGVKPDERKRLVKAILELVRLPDIQERYPHQLSGGQQQRVALARSLVVNPAVVLLDEPLSNLDQKLRAGMRIELKQIQEQSGITFIFVTHDQSEALALSDRIVVMNEGRILQVGTPREIYERPTSRFAADFLGVSNFFEGKVSQVKNGKIRFETHSGLTLYSTLETPGVSVGQFMTMQVRAELIALSSEPPNIPGNCLRGVIVRAVYEGTDVIYQVKLEPENAEVVTVREHAGRKPTIQPGKLTWLLVAFEDALLLPVRSAPDALSGARIVVAK